MFFQVQMQKPGPVDYNILREGFTTMFTKLILFSDLTVMRSAVALHYYMILEALTCI